MTDERMMNIRHRIEAGTKAPTEDELMFEKLCKLDINLTDTPILKQEGMR